MTMEEFRQAVSIILTGSLVSGIIGLLIGCWLRPPSDRRAMKNVKPAELKKKIPVRRSPCEMVYAGDMLADLKEMYRPRATLHVPSSGAHPLISKPIPLN
jgi:hypothetical protein